MIDAYEIGIQLALQDGVSAGLEAISRDLAEVDRGIAATTAGLRALTVVAGGAVRAATSLGVARPAIGSQPLADGGQLASGPRGQGEPKSAAWQPSAPQPLEDTSAGLAPPTVPPEMSMRSTVTAPVFIAQQPELVSPVDSAAPPSSTEAASPTMVQQNIAVSSVAARQVPSGSGALTPGLSAAPAASKNVEAPVIADPFANPSREMVSPVRSAERAREITASVGKAVTTPTYVSSPQISGVAGQPPRAEMPLTQEAAAPSVAGSPHSERASSSFAASERSVAPQPQARDGGEGMTGTVMLDGRLVGYWLSEQMAREASKPPGGTTFFDPRQSPAWNVSGAM